MHTIVKILNAPIDALMPLFAVPVHSANDFNFRYVKFIDSFVIGIPAMEPMNKFSSNRKCIFKKNNCTAETQNNRSLLKTMKNHFD